MKWLRWHNNTLSAYIHPCCGSGCPSQHNHSAKLPERSSLQTGCSSRRGVTRRRHYKSRASCLCALCVTSLPHAVPPTPAPVIQGGHGVLYRTRISLPCLNIAKRKPNYQAYCPNAFLCPGLIFMHKTILSFLLRTSLFFGLRCSLGDPNLRRCLQLSRYVAVQIRHRVNKLIYIRWGNA